MNFHAEDKAACAEEEFKRLLRPLLGLGDRYPDATDIIINGDMVWLLRGLERRPYPLSDFNGLTSRQVQGAARNAARYSGVELGAEKPILLTRIPPDLRITAVLPPIAVPAQLVIRFLRSRVVPLETYVLQGVMTNGQAAELRQYVVEGRNIAISGEMGSGKTTLMRSLVSLIDPMQQIVLIEDTAELNIPGANVRHLLTMAGIGLDILLETALRLSADRLIVGEVRDAKTALNLLTMMGTGHKGVIFTMHSFGKRTAITQLYRLARKMEPRLTREEIEEALDVVVQLGGKGKERKLASIWHVPKEMS